MRVLTLTELMRLTLTELCALAAQVTNALAVIRRLAERDNAVTSLRNIRSALARRDLSP